MYTYCLSNCQGEINLNKTPALSGCTRCPMAEGPAATLNLACLRGRRLRIVWESLCTFLSHPEPRWTKYLMSYSKHQPFSKKWVIASTVIFVVVELFLGGLIGGLVVGKFMSLNLRFMLQGLLNLVSFFIGGFIIGLISPGIRIREPAVGAFLSVSIVLCLSLFTPYSFIQFSFAKMLIGGGVAFLLALAGARLGEKVAGNRT